MKILTISDTTGYMRGGVPAETRELMAGLASRGHLVGFCGDIPVVDSQFATHFPVSLPVGNQLPQQIQGAIDAFAPDVIHVVSMSSAGLMSLKATLAGRPWLLTCHSIPPYERKYPGLHSSELLHYGARNLRFLPNQMAWRWLLSKKFIPRVIAHSDWVSKIVSNYGFDARHISMIPLGSAEMKVDVRSVEVASGSAPRVVTTGGIAHTKGYHDAIRAMSVIRQKRPGATYQIIGEVRDESYFAYLKNLIASLGLQDGVSITPNLPEDDKQRALERADLYLQPSHEEGFCLSYIEAAGRVLRIIGTDSGAIRRISEGDQGARVVPPREPVAMAAAIDELLNAKLPVDLMALRSARLGRTFGWPGYLDAHEALYAATVKP